MSPELIAAYRWHREHSTTQVGHSAEQALTLARAELQGKARAIEIDWVDECEPWDGECEAPPIIAACVAYHPTKRWADGTRIIIGSLGMVGLLSWSDDYVRTVAAEVTCQGLAYLDAEDAEDAEAMAMRATYAAGRVWGTHDR